MAAPDSHSGHWSGTGQMRGGRWGVWFFVTALRMLGLRLTYALAVPPAIYFSFASPDVAATMDFHRRMFGPVPWWKRRWLVFKHFFSFGRALIDRSAITAGETKYFSFTFDGEEHVRAALKEGKGVLLLAAHLGNWEAAGQMIGRLGVPVNITGFDKESPAVRALLNSSPEQKFRLIPLTGSPTDAIELVAALRRGEILAMLGDRLYGGPSARVPFLGGHASFPVGPYVMAASAGAPLIQVFSLREPRGHYHFFGFPALPPVRPPRHERDAHLRECATQFADRLGSLVQREPLQWYNFFPFWDEPASPAAKLVGQAPSPVTRPASAPACSPAGEGACFTKTGEGASPTH